MEFTANQKDLLQELSLAQGVVESRATIPILSNLLLRADRAESKSSKGGDGREGIEVVATDLQVGLRSPCPARVSAAGAATVSAKKLFEIVRALPDAEVEVSSPEKSQIQIACRDSRFRLQTLPPDDFPSLPEPDSKDEIELPRETFQDMAEKVLFAVTRDDNRFALNGALLILQPESMTLVATDGHRLAMVRARHAFKGLREERRTLIPKKALAEILRFRRPLEDPEVEAPAPEAKSGRRSEKAAAPKNGAAPRDVAGHIRFSTDANHLFFRVDDRLLLSRVLEGTFPNFERVLPEGNNRVFTVKRSDLQEAIRRVSLLSYERSRAVKFHVSKKKLTISSSTPQVGEAEEPVAVEYDGPAIEIGFNGDYLMDWVAHVGGDEVQVALRDSETQGLFLPKGEYPFDYQYIIMPMRL